MFCFLFFFLMLPRFYCWAIHYGIDVNSNSHFLKVRLRACYSFFISLGMVFVDFFWVICCFPHCSILSNPDNIKIIYVKEQYNLSSRYMYIFVFSFAFLFYWLLCPMCSSVWSSSFELWVSTLVTRELKTKQTNKQKYIYIYIYIYIYRTDIRALPAEIWVHISGAGLWHLYLYSSQVILMLLCLRNTGWEFRIQ